MGHITDFNSYEDKFIKKTKEVITDIYSIETRLAAAKNELQDAEMDIKAIERSKLVVCNEPVAVEALNEYLEFLGDKKSCCEDKVESFLEQLVSRKKDLRMLQEACPHIEYTDVGYDSHKNEVKYKCNLCEMTF